MYQIAKEKNGIVLVTGATGSGKTTCLAAILDEINEERSVHIVTLEDPVEYVHPHKKATFNQRELGMDFDTFANGLRAALRQAPKVILVGEMRDRETVEIGLSAAETGHLVLTTLHTIDAGADHQPHPGHVRQRGGEADPYPSGGLPALDSSASGCCPKRAAGGSRPSKS